MNDGLDLEPFLRLLRADPGVWLTAGAIVVILAIMAWTSWGSRRALRKCLVLSILAHLGLIVYSNRFSAFGTFKRHRDEIPRRNPRDSRESNGRCVVRIGRDLHQWRRGKDQNAGLGPARPRAGPRRATTPARPSAASAESLTRERASEAVAAPAMTNPEVQPPELPKPREDREDASAANPPALAAAPSQPDENPVAKEADPLPVSENGLVRQRTRMVPPDADSIRPQSRPRTDLVARNDTRDIPPPPVPSLDPNDNVAGLPAAAPEVDRNQPAVANAPPSNEPPRGNSPTEMDLRSRTRPPLGGVAGAAVDRRPNLGLPPLTIARAGAARPPDRVPEPLRMRVEPNRVVRAEQLGATAESERAVERALDWLARHQDADGRWNAGTRKAADAKSPLASEHSFTAHCPADDVCEGECFYYEADTAMTGLALLAYLGAGSTHTQPNAKYAATVRKGLQFLLSAQKPDGDLRGEGRAVGIYCHAMATLALCEAFALTGDEALRDPVDRAVSFLMKSRAADGMSWRYKPGDPSGDTSILGWAVLVIKSAGDAGFAVPDIARVGALRWLERVAEGPQHGLAVYRPGEGPTGGTANYVPGRNRTPTMTAEAWVCRQLLGAGGPGTSSDEAALSARKPPATRHAQFLLLVLRHACDVPTRGPILGALEPPRSRQPDRAPKDQRPRSGKLGSAGQRHDLRRARRTNLRHSARSHDTRSLLPLRPPP